MIIKTSIYLFICSFLISCEGQKHLVSILVSNDSGNPVSDATVYHLNRKGDTLQITSTDSTGIIIFDSGFTGMMFGGTKFRYQIAKEGFKTLEGEEKWPASKLILERVKN